MKDVLVVTNNPMVKDEVGGQNLKVKYIEGKAQKVLLLARDLVISGWHLAADPRGGYNKRYNPYHTVFLCDEEMTGVGDDVLVLEKLALFNESPYNPNIVHTERELNDFRILDLSIAKRTAERIKLYTDEF